MANKVIIIPPYRALQNEQRKAANKIFSPYHYGRAIIWRRRVRGGTVIAAGMAIWAIIFGFVTGNEFVAAITSCASVLIAALMFIPLAYHTRLEDQLI